MRRLATALCCAALVACDGDIRLTSGDGGAPQDAAEAGAAVAPAPVGCTTPGGACTYGHCDTISKTCVECVADDQCSGDRPRCDLAIGRCVACGLDADCKSGEKCERSTRRCARDCNADAACPSDTPVCDLARGICVACTPTSAACATDRFCDVGGRCAECASDTHCTGEKRRCDPLAGACVACLVSSDCPASAPHCDPAKLECREH